ncbi:Uncharacterised protein [Candidatus Gugararchaeum adminiculabundum]|nr:Uncharacterised protein [Candidatus Gugararchaeum adminiculabundum]
MLRVKKNAKKAPGKNLPKILLAKKKSKPIPKTKTMEIAYGQPTEYATEHIITPDREPFGKKYSLPEIVRDDLGNTSWETILALANHFSFDHRGKGDEIRKLSREIHMTKMILLTKISHLKERGEFDARLFSDLVRLLERCEEMSELYNVDLNEFMTFVYLLVEKMKRERLLIYKSKQRATCATGDFAPNIQAEKRFH